MQQTSKSFQVDPWLFIVDALAELGAAIQELRQQQPADDAAPAQPDDEPQPEPTA